MSPQYLSFLQFIAQTNVIITADVAPIGEKNISLKKKIDETLVGVSSIQHVLVAKRTGERVNMEVNRDMYLEEVCSM